MGRRFRLRTVRPADVEAVARGMETVGWPGKRAQVAFFKEHPACVEVVRRPATKPETTQAVRRR